MTIEIVTFLGVCVFVAIASAVITYYVLKNNPGLIDEWAKDLLAKKDRLLAEAKEKLAKAGIK